MTTTTTATHTIDLRKATDNQLRVHIAVLEDHIQAKETQLREATQRHALRQHNPIPPFQLRQQLQQLRIDHNLAIEEQNRRIIP